MDELISADNARLLMLHNHSDTYNRFLDALQCTIDKRESSFSFYPITEDDFTEVEIKYIKDMGYNIIWNSACQWYNISF